MRLTINSPLAPCQLPDSGQLSSYQAIGLVTDVAMSHSHYIDSSVGNFLERLMPALNAGNAKVFFDENSRPYGYVSWVTLPEALHHSLLANTWSTSTDLAQFFNKSPGDKLWFFDLLCPFSSPLNMLRALKHEMNSYDSAFLAPNPYAESNMVRRMW